MDRLISEQEVLNTINAWFYELSEQNISTLQGMINAIPSAKPTDVDEALRILDAINSSGRLNYSDYCELHDAISMISADEDEWVKRSDVLRVVEKRIDERLSDPYKGMTNGEVIKAMFPQYTYMGVCVFDKNENIILHDINWNWWNSPYESQESEVSE